MITQWLPLGPHIEGNDIVFWLSCQRSTATDIRHQRRRHCDRHITVTKLQRLLTPTGMGLTWKRKCLATSFCLVISSWQWWHTLKGLLSVMSTVLKLFLIYFYVFCRDLAWILWRLLKIPVAGVGFIGDLTLVITALPCMGLLLTVYWQLCSIWNKVISNAPDYCNTHYKSQNLQSWVTQRLPERTY